VKHCRVAATQIDVRHGDVEHNLETHLGLIDAAAAAGCDLVVFPELSVTGHNGSPEVMRTAERADGRIARVIHGAARESPGFPLRKRRPETYEELTLRS